MTSLKEVAIPARKGLDAYEALMPERVQDLRTKARELGTLSILHVNATPLGGGVAEMLGSQVRLERDLGLESRWFVLDAPPEFFAATKKIHNLLQGRNGMLTEQEKDIFLSVNNEFAEQIPSLIPDQPCVAVIHDPQPAPLTTSIGKQVPTVLRLHIDLSTPNAPTMEFLRPHIQAAHRVMISSQVYADSMPWLAEGQTTVSYPAIDPFTDKNAPMTEQQAWLILEGFGVNPTKPLISQVSRFDPWKDPLGVIRAYYIAKKKLPDLQLLMAGFILAQDDPEAVSIFEDVERHATGDPDIYLFADPSRLREFSNDTFINAVYTASMMILQKSIREGFGMTITEAMWKSKPVIVGATTGTEIQVTENENGIIVKSPEEAADAIVRLHNDENLRTRIGKAGHESVSEQFLIPRLIGDFLQLYTDLRPDR